jgi:HK97 family phage major capsid protein
MITAIKLETRAYPSYTEMSERQLLEVRNVLMDELESIINKAKIEKRALSGQETNQFQDIKDSIQEIDKLIQDLKLKLDGGGGEMRMIKSSNQRISLPLEVRGYSKGENIGKGSNVNVGDLIYSYVTGRFRSTEVREALSTTSGGLAVPTEVYQDFIDLLRNQSFLGDTTVYPMTSQTLLVPRVTDDIVPAFKLENDLAVEDAPMFTSITLQAKPLYAMTSISLELLESSNLDIGQVISQIMISSMQNAMQNFMLFGAVNGYSGILTDTGINTVTGAASYANIGAGVQAIRGANGQPNAIIAASDTLMGLELATDTTGQFITPPKFYQDLDKYSVNGTGLGADVVLADLSAIAWGILSDGGLQIEIDKSGEAFQRGQIKVRARFNGDFKLTNPKLVARVDAP